MRSIRIALAQIDTTVGDFAGNLNKILKYIEESDKLGADIIAFPELAVCGYPPEDLLFYFDFLEKSQQTIDEIAEKTKTIDSIIIVGFPEKSDWTYNSAAIIYRGKIWDIYRKIFLPNYGVFDEKRYFADGNRIPVYDTPDFRFGVGICEDIWHSDGPISVQSSDGDCEIVININSSPYHRGKRKVREQMLATTARDNAIPVAYLNCIGGQDELVFDGQSFVVSLDGKIIARAKSFEEQLLVVDIDLADAFRQKLHTPIVREIRTEQVISNRLDIVQIPFSHRLRKPKIENIIAQPSEPSREIWDALVLGLSDYVRKNNFKSVVLGLSGGIDSSLVAAIAADAIGAENVNAIFMPTKFTASQSYNDAKKLVENLGINFLTIEIEPLFEQYLKYLEPYFEGKPYDITEENLQSRIRGNISMAFSNKFGHLVLATGNKSEMSVGYATLYGDMVGGFAVIKDVPKTLVWELARWRNEYVGKELIPKSIIDRPPTAELRNDQLDTDSLPPYDILDRIIRYYVENEMSADEVIEKTKIEPSIVRKVARMVDKSEYKRRQSPPGIKITERAFGKERRMPITKKEF
ncbi:NAD+ synthase [bacterium]|nr:NAD+ synthase [bacterium]